MNKGFTLIELSIVLIIISLVVAATIGGKALIHSAELNAVTSEIKSFKISINTFKLQYNTLPGDMANARAYWPALCLNNAAIGGGCDGNDDGWVSKWEGPRLWQHLMLADLISGPFSNANTHSLAPVGGSAWYYWGNFDWNALFIPTSEFKSTFYIAGGENGQSVITTAGKHPTNPNLISSGPFVPHDARAIDRKIDDGKPYGGKLIETNLPGSTCDLANTGAYNVSDTVNSTCGLMFSIK